MPSRVELQKVYYHPRTHKRITQAQARTYYRRTHKRIRPQQWLIVRDVVGETRGLAPEQIANLKRRAGRITYAARLTRIESILKLSSLKERHIRRTLADHRVFKKLYDDFEVPGDIQRRGMIRLTLNGTLDGRRLKKVIHLGFMKSAWVFGYGRSGDAKEGFKDWLVGAVLSNLRRRGLRVSDPVESQGRIADLSRNREGMLQMLEMEENAAKRGGWLERIKWVTDAIRTQKKSRQLRGVTMKVEKVI